MKYSAVLLFCFFSFIGSSADHIKTIKSIPAGTLYTRIPVKNGSFAHYLRALTLYHKGRSVYLHNGLLKENQNAHYAVIKMSIGKRNLQQCADAIMRLRAEYFYSKKQYNRIVFNFTSGHAVPFSKWAAGYRTVVRGSHVYMIRNGRKGYDRKNFMSYLRTIFTYAGTLSLEKEMQKQKIKNIKIGDVFIKGGSPGHAVIVVDMAQHKLTGKKIFLLAQSYMPAQNIHVLKNPVNRTMSPWYPADFRGKLYTPEWTFQKKHLRRF